jgi:hypothetical protein
VRVNVYLIVNEFGEVQRNEDRSLILFFRKKEALNYINNLTKLKNEKYYIIKGEVTW